MYQSTRNGNYVPDAAPLCGVIGFALVAADKSEERPCDHLDEPNNVSVVAGTIGVNTSTHDYDTSRSLVFSR
jgi:hypothetical protein